MRCGRWPKWWVHYWALEGTKWAPCTTTCACTKEGDAATLTMDAVLCTQLSAVLQGPEVAHASASGGPQLPPGANTTYVCVGDEWHRFPSAFFLPGPAYRLAFVRAGFRGLLPRAFDLAQVRGVRAILPYPYQIDPALLYGDTLQHTSGHGVWCVLCCSAAVRCVAEPLCCCIAFVYLRRGGEGAYEPLPCKVARQRRRAS